MPAGVTTAYGRNAATIRSSARPSTPTFLVRRRTRISSDSIELSSAAETSTSGTYTGPPRSVQSNGGPAHPGPVSQGARPIPTCSGT